MTETGSEQNNTLFRDINADDDDPEVTQIESLCLNCHEQGMTRLFLTRIPFFREVIVSSFSCDQCGSNNSELQSAGRIQDKAVKYTVKVITPQDLNRQVVQTDSATISIPELEFESPPNKGVMTTVEGMINRAVEGLNQDQVLRRIQHPDDAAQIDKFVEKLTELKTLKSPFHLVLDDPSGNSFIENPFAPKLDPETKVVHYKRSKEQNEALCIQESEEKQTEPEPEFNAKDEVLQFQSNCPGCTAPSSCKMKLVDIPHFKEIVLMATSCDACGLRDSEVKGGAGIEPQGRRISLKMTDVSDLTRDVLKSDMCSVEIPELDFSTGMTSTTGKFTTVEGLIDDIITELKKANPFFLGDSGQEDKLYKMSEFCDKLEKIKSGETLDVHVILDDPTGNSYLQNVYAPDPDPNMEIVNYDRTEEQNEDLGLNDMKTENY
ncbi:zinc finger protein ZPR1-like isoform X2 [Mercenaria mercenaria]|uniref:zinc finger protein ZPR1-like isoform X2 n=1 Tax=Mercenaria mercenaria TaxID=6596 RepID=UPI001E1D943B|nr:zinc finger protein ZPR1-like isoform X2 [Mercenaria mercenaria]